MLFGWTRRIGKNYAVDISLFHLYRSLKDGLTAFEFRVDSDWYRGDHNPQFGVFIAFLNIALLDVRVYNVHHCDDPKDAGAL